MGQFSFEQKIEIVSKMALDYCEENGLKFKEYNQKFAELIIKECAAKLESDGMVEVAMELKQHFTML